MPQVIIDIPVSQIIMDRWSIGLRTLALVEHLKRGGSVPPIHVQPTANGQWTILDGRHRVTASKFLERTHILARYGYIPEINNLVRRERQL